MPRYTDPASGKSISSAEPLSDADLEEAFGGGAEQPSTWAQVGEGVKRGAGYLGSRAMEMGRAAGRLAAFPSERSLGQTASDAATLAAPVMAPGLTALGAGVGAVARGFGAQQDVAEGLDTAATLAGGGIGLLRGAARGLTAGPAAAKAATKAAWAEADTLGAGMTGNPVQVERLAAKLREAIAWGGTSGRERRVAKAVLARIESGAPLTYEDLNSAKAGLESVRGLSRVRGALDTHIGEVVGGMPAGPARAAAKAATTANRQEKLRRSMGLLPTVSAGGGMIDAYHQAQEGHYGRAATSAGLGLAGAWGLRHLSPRGIKYAAQGMAGPAARGAVAVAGSPAVRHLGRDAPGARGAPIAPETRPESSPSSNARPEPSPREPRASADREGEAIARVVGIPHGLMAAVQRRENPRQDPTIVSADPSGPGGGGAVGLMQLLPSTFEELRPEVERLIGRRAVITNPLDNRVAGALYLRQGLERTGSIEGAARYYHGGPSATMHGPRTRAYGEAIVRNFGG